MNFFKVASIKKVVNMATVNNLMALITLKNTAPEACVAVIIVNDSSNAEYTALVAKFWAMTSPNATAEEQMVGAQCIGEYGKIQDLSGEDKVIPTVKGLF